MTARLWVIRFRMATMRAALAMSSPSSNQSETGSLIEIGGKLGHALVREVGHPLLGKGGDEFVHVAEIENEFETDLVSSLEGSGPD